MIALALHGGSGTLNKTKSNQALEAKYEAALHQALELGWCQLTNGSSSLDTVEMVVKSLEDSPLFNAGRGSVLNHDGKVEMDASCMDGQHREAGAVAGVTGIRNPISLARKVLEDPSFVFLIGNGAEEFADFHKIPREEESYFLTIERFDQLQESLTANTMLLDHDADGEKFGTVGAVALDENGNLAAATSTGGLTNKRFGRVGDSPIIGAGTYADNRSCAVSCTGYGEEFIRLNAAYNLHAQVLYSNQSIARAGRELIHRDLTSVQGQGGLICVDARGNLTLPFNTQGMYRAWRNAAGEDGVAIFED